jgi:hypothetical protein
MLNDAPRRASRPTASRNYTPRARPMFSIARAAAAARDASESGRDAGIVCRRAAIVRATSGCCIRRPVPRDRSRAPTASPRTVFGDGPASRFANLRSGSRHPRRAQSGDRFFIPRRARNRSVGGCRISGFPSTSSRGRRRADVVVVVVVARRVAAVEDASATRARRERDANRREPTTVRAAAIERRGATEARARRFAFDLESRRSFASTREFRRVEGANADDARARDVG